MKNTKTRKSDIAILISSSLINMGVKKFVLYPTDIGWIKVFLLYLSVGIYLIVSTLFLIFFGKSIT